MRILADENIPFACEAFGELGEVVLVAGRSLTPAQVRDADVLLVRSVTQVNAALLNGSSVRFIGSATIGTDHVDQPYLRKRGLAFAHAPGSNADSVAEYVLTALLWMAVRRGEALPLKTAGVVGCGNVGARVARRLEALGLRVLRCDPFLAHTAIADRWLPLEALLAEADLLTLHVPLTHNGPHPTHHLIDEAALAQLQTGAWLVNTARGPVVDSAALRRARHRLGALVLDVWEREPTPDPALLRVADVATPHIAGYSYDGKIAGTRMLFDALTAHLGVPATWDATAALRLTDADRRPLPQHPADLPLTPALFHLAQACYDLPADDARMRSLLARPTAQHAAAFAGLRKHYPRRRSFSCYTLPFSATLPSSLLRAATEGLGLQAVSG